MNRSVSRALVVGLIGSATCAADAQWLISPWGVWLNSGNVGIGTSSPRHDIHIRTEDPRGILAVSLATSGFTTSVEGINKSTSGRAIYGFADSATGVTTGVYGQAASTLGRGVYGYATAMTGANYGVYGRSNSESGRGVFGFAASESGLSFGLYGLSNSTAGRGVFGYSTAATGFTFGVFGRTDSTTGRGVFGTSLASTGQTYGVLGQAASPSGTGVAGSADAGTGVQGNTMTGVAVAGDARNGGGLAGSFIGGNVHVANRLGVGTTEPINALEVTGKISLTQSGMNDDMVLINDDVWRHRDGDQDFGDGGDHFIIASREGSSESAGVHGGGDILTFWSAGDSAPGQPSAICYFLDEDFFNNDGNPYDDGALRAYLNTSGTWIASDVRRKQAIQRIEGASDRIRQLSGYTYEYTRSPQEANKGAPVRRDAGLIAQELVQVVPEAVDSNADGELFVNLTSVVPVLVGALREQIERNDELEAQHEQLEARLRHLERLLGQ